MNTRLHSMDANARLIADSPRIAGQSAYDVHTTSRARECMLKLHEMQPGLAVLCADLVWVGAQCVRHPLCDDRSVVRPRVVLTTGETCFQARRANQHGLATHCEMSLQELPYAMAAGADEVDQPTEDDFNPDDTDIDTDDDFDALDMSDGDRAAEETQPAQ